MEKRYQVFVSSTYQDLQQERQEIMQALLELDCMPSGMELFPAANDDQWTLIKKVIDDSDYYIVIIGGRYGSIGPTGVGYTEMEYRYALEKNKPIIAFLHKSPQDLAAIRTEQDKVGRDKLQEFRSLAERKLVKYWTTPSDLGSIVSRSLIMLTKNNPAVGWVRADNISNEAASQEILKLRKQIDELNEQLKSARTEAPAGSDNLSQGNDETLLHYSFGAYKSSPYTDKEYNATFTTSWNIIFSHIGANLIDEATEHVIKKSLNNFIADEQYDALADKKEFTGFKIRNFEIDETDFQTIKIQLRALGLITKSARSRSVKNMQTYWTLTPYGDEVLTKLRAIRK